MKKSQTADSRKTIIDERADASNLKSYPNE